MRLALIIDAAAAATHAFTHTASHTHTHTAVMTTTDTLLHVFLLFSSSLSYLVFTTHISLISVGCGGRIGGFGGGERLRCGDRAGGAVAVVGSGDEEG